jgi:hypothetical protein
MSNEREQFREAARECLRLAQLTNDSKLRQILRRHAQEWLKLAYAGQLDRFRDALASPHLDVGCCWTRWRMPEGPDRSLLSLVDVLSVSTLLSDCPQKLGLHAAALIHHFVLRDCTLLRCFDLSH